MTNGEDWSSTRLKHDEGSRKRVVLTAAYGMGNVGDEAICEVAVRDLLDLDPGVEVTVLAWHPELWRAAHPDLTTLSRVRVRRAFLERRQLKSLGSIVDVLRSMWSVARCDCLIWGGGGIVRDRPYWLRAYLGSVRLGRLLRKRVLVLSIGVDTITRRDVRSMLGVLPSALAVSVRDVQSRSHLLEAVPRLNGRVEVISDGAFRWPSSKQSAPDRPTVIGMNLCQEQHPNDERYERFLDDLADLFGRLHRLRALSLVLLPTVKRDRIFCADFVERLPEIPARLEQPRSPHEYLGALQGCHLFVGMRMHALILASRVDGLPFCGFVYSEKVRQLRENARAERLLWPVGFDASQVLEDMCGLLDRTIPPPDFSRLCEDAARQREFLREHVFSPAEKHRTP